MKVAVIPARGGSKRIPRKNIRDFAGKPIIAYSIDCAKQSGLFDRIIVSTDDEEIADVARDFGAEVPFLRPPDLADVLESVPEDERLRVVRLMAAPLASEVLHNVQEGDRQEIFEELSPEERAEIVHESRSDDAADLIGELPPEEQEETLEQLAGGPCKNPLPERLAQLA